MEKLLIELGFEHMTGPLWNHRVTGMIPISEEDKPADLVRKIYDRGHGECQLMIRSALGLNNQ